MLFPNLPIISIRSWRFVMHAKCQKCSPRASRWHDHVNHVQAPKAFQHWLTDRGSLTAKLIASSNAFRVQRIFQQPDFCWGDEYAAIGLSRPTKVHTREVLLRCNGRPAVFAHTVMPLDSNASQWPLFRTLGNKSLGSTLFGDPQVVRGAMQYARLHPNHPAMQRAMRLTRPELNDMEQQKFTRAMFARRSLFFRRGGVMLVTELFLPTIEQLSSKLNIKSNRN